MTAAPVTDTGAVWVTRAQPGAEETARRLRLLGWTPLVAPLLAVRPLATTLDLAGVGAIALTSANAARALAAATPVRDLPVFAVGDATAAAAREVGFARVDSADGDVAVLAERIAARAATLAGAVLHPGAERPAGDLTGDLARHGVPARAVALYATVEVEPGPAVAAALAGPLRVLLHSPRAAAALAAVLRQTPAPAMTALCLSPAVATALARTALAGLLTAPSPREEALLALLPDRGRSATS